MEAAAFATWRDACRRRSFRRSAASVLFLCWFAACAATLGLCADEPPSREGAVPAAESAADEKLEYNRDIRPILSEACFACHGPDSAARQADLRLDQREAAVDYGAIVPGDASQSVLVERISSDDDELVMPPRESKKTLTPEQREILARWIDEGAEYQPHWAFIAPKRPELPAVRNSWWGKNPIDRFIAARLEAENLTPAPEADRRTLARRVSLDLTGLPPSPSLVNSFVNDTSPDAYERLVDKLLESPAWGEHRARYWLDVARYADTHGIHFDNYREMWTYRDWVIRAFNRNLPYDRFTIENLAGDLMPHATQDERIGSGFNRCNITTNEGGAIDEEYLVLYARDRTETTAQAFLGLTAGCAVCHDHKFDPLTQREFYALSAFFSNTTQAAMDGNVKDTPPVEVVTLKRDRKRWEELSQRQPQVHAEAEQRKGEAKPDFEKWLAAAAADDATAWMPSEGLHLRLPLNDGGDVLAWELSGKSESAPRPENVEWKPGKLGKRAAHLKNGEILAFADAGDFEHDQPWSVTVWVYLPEKTAGGALVGRMDDKAELRGWDLWFDQRRVAGHLINAWPEKAIKVVTKEPILGDAWNHVAVVYDGSGKAAGVTIYVNGTPAIVQTDNDTLSGSIRTNTPLKIGQRRNVGQVKDVSVEDVRIYTRPLKGSEVAALSGASLLPKVLATNAEDRSEKDVEPLYAWWLAAVDEAYSRLFAQDEAMRREQVEIRRRGTVAHVMHEKETPAAAYVLNRGEYDQRRDKVTPGTPAMLPPFPADLPRDRLGLAQWIVRSENPLAARVAVNRFWQEVFGTGLVATPGDFGVTGQAPSHPELLDWLAVDFRESGWDVKRLFRLMVTSAAYRQSAAATSDKLERDPSNRLLARGPRFRMEAEMIRDLALATSGLLSPKLGGPSVKPYQPPGVWEAVAMMESDTRIYNQDHGDKLYRRSMYTFWKRAAPPTSMEILNAPSREVCLMIRERTNTPMQALVTLNDPQFVEAARNLATRAIRASGGEFARRCDYLSERLLSRRLRPAEREVVRASVAKIAAHYEQSPEEAAKLLSVGESKSDPSIVPSELAAWTLAASELMNLDEALTK